MVQTRMVHSCMQFAVADPGQRISNDIRNDIQLAIGRAFQLMNIFKSEPVSVAQGLFMIFSTFISRTNSMTSDPLTGGQRNRFISSQNVNAHENLCSSFHEIGHVSLSRAHPDNEISVLEMQRTILRLHWTRFGLPNSRQSIKKSEIVDKCTVNTAQWCSVHSQWFPSATPDECNQIDYYYYDSLTFEISVHRNSHLLAHYIVYNPWNCRISKKLKNN